MTYSGNKILKTLIAVPVMSVGLFIAGYLMTWSTPTIAPTVADDTLLSKINVNGAVLHAETFGDPDAPAVIVIHGGPGEDYRSLLSLQKLSDQFHVVFYDQRGSGLSARVPAEQLNLDTFVADVGAVVDRFAGDEPAHIVGHSWGGGLAAIFAARNPDRVARLVLAEPIALTPEMAAGAESVYGPSFDPRFMARGMWYWLTSLHIEATDQHIRSDYLFTMMAPHANPGHYCENGVSFPESDTLMWRFGTLAANSVHASLLDHSGMLQDDLLDGIDAYSSEVLFLTGECSKLLGPEIQTLQMGLFPRSRMVQISDSGHMMFVDQPTRSVDAVRSHLLSLE